MKNIGIKKIKIFLKAAPCVMAERSFLFSIIFIFLALIIGGLIFYQYDLLVDKKQPETIEVSIKLQEKTYLFILDEWQNRKNTFDSADFKNWPDPFSSAGFSTSSLIE